MIIIIKLERIRNRIKIFIKKYTIEKNLPRSGVLSRGLLKITCKDGLVLDHG